MFMAELLKVQKNNVVRVIREKINDVRVIRVRITTSLALVKELPACNVVIGKRTHGDMSKVRAGHHVVFYLKNCRYCWVNVTAAGRAQRRHLLMCQEARW